MQASKQGDLKECGIAKERSGVEVLSWESWSVWSEVKAKMSNSLFATSKLHMSFRRTRDYLQVLYLHYRTACSGNTRKVGAMHPNAGQRLVFANSPKITTT